MKRIRNIVFDFGGVLLDWNPRHLYRNYFSDEQQMEYFLANVCTGPWNVELDRGRPFAEAIKELQAENPEYREAIGLFKSRWGEMVKSEIPGTVELLRDLKARGFALYGLTNWSAETLPIAYERFDFFGLFDGIVVSGDEKLIKPDPRIYRVLLDRYGLDARESVFIDDNADNIKAAQELGFEAILFDTPGHVREQLDALLTRCSD